MSVNVSCCYYHEGKAAVGVCAQCGAGICRECAVKDDTGRIICYKCGNKKLKQEHKQAKEMIKQQGGRFRNGSEFIKPGIIGGVLMIGAGLGLINDGFLMLGHGSIIAFIMIEYMIFSIPFAMIMLRDLFAARYMTLNDHWGMWLLKLFVSLLIGWIVFTFYLIRFVRTKRKSAKTKTNTNNEEPLNLR